MIVAELLDHFPETIRVFIRHRMACVGCVMAPFETVAEVADIYGLHIPQFLGELHQTIRTIRERS